MVKFSSTRRNRKVVRKARRATTRKAPRTRMGRKVTSRNGMIRIKRQAQSIVIKNTAALGVAAASGYSGAAVLNSLVQVGTPEVDNNYAHGGIYNVPFTCQFSMNQVTNYTELSGICDRYKLAGVAIKVKYNANTFDPAIATSVMGNQPVFKWVRDNDDSALEAVSTLQQKQGLTERLLGNGRFVKIFLKPKAKGYAIGGGAAGGIVMRAPYIDASNVDIPHYGLKGYIEGMNLQTTASLDSVLQFEFTYYLTLRDLR